MNTETFVKCRCQNCSGHIEFEASAAGQTINCPHCGMDTILFIPRSAPQTAASPIVEAPPRCNLIACRDCGREISIHAQTCPHCGAPGTAAAAQAVELPILSEAGITVTKARIVFPDRVFAMANVSSVRCIQISPKHTAPIIAIIFAVLLSAANIYVGGVSVLLALTWLFALKDSYGLAITAAGGEVTGYVTKQQKLAERVLAAINKAIICRG